MYTIKSNLEKLKKTRTEKEVIYFDERTKRLELKDRLKLKGKYKRLD